MALDDQQLVARNNSYNSLADYTITFGRKTVNLEWRNITYKTQTGKTILYRLHGSSNSGQLTAIMGPSGSGKTSLMNVLSGFTLKGVTGEILVNGAKREPISFQKLTCYILQDDHILPQFTVRELITFASRLKIPSIFTEKEKQKAVDDCIYCLGLVAQQHQKANTLSGGQRKRLSIAQEIVNNPPLIFLDEPTSGLDSSSCFQFVQLLKNLTEGNRNIICSIHQPSSKIFETFDNLYMLSDGDCIYRGPTKDLLTYLENKGLQCPKYHSPTDFITDVAIGLYGEWNWRLKEAIKADDSQNDEWYKVDCEDIYKSNGRNRMGEMFCSFTTNIKAIAQKNWQDIAGSQYPTSSLNQFKVLLRRTYLDILRDPINLKLKFAGSIAIGALLGSMFYDTGNDGSKVFNTAGLMFTLIIFLVVTSKIPTVLTFPLQRVIFEREHLNGWYSTKMYFLANSLATIPLQIICPIISCSLIYGLTGQPMEIKRLGLFLLTGILISMISESLGLMIGAATTVQTGAFLSVLSGSVSVLLSGFFLPLRNTPAHLKWLCEIAFTRYSFRALILDIYQDRKPLNCTTNFCYYRDPKILLHFIDMNGDLYLDIWRLFIFLFVFKILSYLILELKTFKLK